MSQEEQAEIILGMVKERKELADSMTLLRRKLAVQLKASHDYCESVSMWLAAPIATFPGDGGNVPSGAELYEGLKDLRDSMASHAEVDASLKALGY